MSQFPALPSSSTRYTVSGVSAGLVLTPGQSAALDVTFTPSAAGNLAGGITVTSNATNSPAIVSLNGSGTQTVSHSAALSWDASPSVVAGYNVYRSALSGGPYSKLNPYDRFVTLPALQRLLGARWSRILLYSNSCNLRGRRKRQLSRGFRNHPDPVGSRQMLAPIVLTRLFFNHGWSRYRQRFCPRDFLFVDGHFVVDICRHSRNSYGQNCTSDAVSGLPPIFTEYSSIEAIAGVCEYTLGIFRHNNSINIRVANSNSVRSASLSSSVTSCI